MSLDELAALADFNEESAVSDESMEMGGEETGEEQQAPPVEEEVQEEPFEFANMKFPGGKRQAEEGIQNLYNQLQQAQQRNSELSDALRRALDGGTRQSAPSSGEADPLDEHVQAILETAALNDPKRFIKEQLKRMKMVAEQVQSQRIEEGLEKKVQDKFSVFAPYVIRERFVRDPNMADIHDSADEFAFLTSQGMAPEQAAAFIRNVKSRGKQPPVSNPGTQMQRSPGLESPGRGSPGKTKKVSEDEVFKKLLGKIYD